MGVRGVQKGKNHVTIVLGRSHNSSHACNSTKKSVFNFFYFGPIWGRNHCGQSFGRSVTFQFNIQIFNPGHPDIQIMIILIMFMTLIMIMMMIIKMKTQNGHNLAQGVEKVDQKMAIIRLILNLHRNR